MRISDWSSDVCSSDLARDEVRMRRPRAQCPKSQGIKGHVERDEAVLRYVDRGPSIDRRRRQRRQRVEEEGSSTLGVLRLPGGEMVLVETEPHPETLESLFAEPVFQPVEDVDRKST